MKRLVMPLRAKQRCPAGGDGFTLIELLICIAVLSVLTVGAFMMLILTVRVERGVTRQREALEQAQLLYRTWHSDVRAAYAARERAGDYQAGQHTLILGVADAGTSQAEIRVFQAQANPDRSIAVDRIRLSHDGKRISTQRLAASLDEAVFDSQGTSGVLTLRLDAKRGFAPHYYRLNFTAAAVLGGGVP